MNDLSGSIVMMKKTYLHQQNIIFIKMNFLNFQIIIFNQIINFKNLNKSKLSKLSEFLTLDSNKKPKCDTTNTKYKILPNGLKVMYISDPSAMMTYFSLTFHVGSNQNPPKVKGLAHFLEHILFMNSEKQPTLDYFRDLVLKLNGDYNGGTGSNLTDFQFNVQLSTSQELEEILDVFVQMFISPIINEENLASEVHAVDSEQSINSTQEVRHLYDAVQEYFHTGHPMSNFSCGNKKSLWESFSDKNFIIELVKLFRSSHYNANNASLVVYGPMTDKDLDIISNNFSQMINFDFDKELNEFKTKYPKIELSEQFNSSQELKDKQENILPFDDSFKAFEIKSIEDTNKLTLLFQIRIIPSAINHTLFRLLIKQFIEYPKKGFLNYHLKEHQDIMSMMADIGNEQLDQIIVHIDILLSEKQIKDNDQLINITKCFYKYLDQLSKMNEKTLNKIQHYGKDIEILLQDFTFPSFEEYMENSIISANILEQGFEQAMNAHVSFEHEQIEINTWRSILNQMSESSLFIILKPAANNTNPTWALTSPNYQAKYNILCESNTCRKSAWTKYLNQFNNDHRKNIQKSCDVTFNSSISKELELKLSLDYQKSHEYPRTPQQLKYDFLEDSNNINAQFLKDGYFKLPKTAIEVQINSNLMANDIESEILNTVFLNSINHYLQTIETWIWDVGFEVDLSSNILGTHIFISGFDKWALEVFQTVISQLDKFEIDQDILIKQVDILIMNYLVEVNQPSQKKALEKYTNLLVKYKKSDDTLYLQTLNKLKQDLENKDFMNIFRTKFKTTVGKTDIFGIGTLEESEFKEMVKKYSLFITKTDDKFKIAQKQVKLTKQVDSIMLPSFNPVESQTTVLQGYQIDFSPDNIHTDVILTNLIMKNLDNSIFTELRTEKQIGQVAYFDGGRSGDTVQLYGLVQGNKQPKDKMVSLYDQWFKDFIKDETEISKEDQDNMKDSYLDYLQGNFRELDDKCHHIFKHIFDEDLNFNQHSDLLKAAQGLDLKKQREFVHQLGTEAKFVKMVVQPEKGKDGMKKSSGLLAKIDKDIQKMGQFSKKMVR